MWSQDCAHAWLQLFPHPEQEEEADEPEHELLHEEAQLSHPVDFALPSQPSEHEPWHVVLQLFPHPLIAEPVHELLQELPQPL